MHERNSESSEVDDYASVLWHHQEYSPGNAPRRENTLSPLLFSITRDFSLNTKEMELLL